MKKLMSILKQKRFLNSGLIIAGGCFSFAFAPYYQIYLIFVLLPFLFGRLNSNISKATSFMRGFCFGFGFGAVSTRWIANAILLDSRLFWVVPLAWAGMGLLFGLFWGIPAYLSSFYPSGLKRWGSWAALLTVFEWIRSWIFTGFPWNLTGSVWENTLPILQSASVWGIYGLSFLTILTASSLALWPRKKVIVLSTLCLSFIYGIGALRVYTAPEEQVWGIKLRLVQPNISQNLKWDPQEAENSFLKLMKLSRQNNDQITHTIWPEAAVTFLVNRDPAERIRLMQAVQQGGTLILGGLRAVSEENRDVANSLFILDDLAQIQAFYDKSHLVPFGEYVPLRGILPIDKIVPIAYDLSSGQGPQTLRVPKTPPLGPLVCYEVIFSGQVVNAKQRPSWLVNVTNDGWYGLSAGPYQHLGMAKMRAVEEGLPLVRVANTGISAVFDGYGRTMGLLPLGTEGVLDLPLPTALPITFYARFGTWFPIGFCVLLLLILGIRKK